MAPLLVAVIAAVLQLLAAGAARELAGNAAGAGAAALLQGLDAEDAARDALPGWSRSRVRVVVRGEEVRVRVRPVALVPGLAGLLVADARASAGRLPRPVVWLDRTERVRPGAGRAGGGGTR